MLFLTIYTRSFRLNTVQHCESPHMHILEYLAMERPVRGGTVTHGIFSCDGYGGF